MATREQSQPRQFRLTAAAWSGLEQIARARGLDWGGIPNRSAAVEALVRDELDRISATESRAAESLIKPPGPVGD